MAITPPELASWYLAWQRKYMAMEKKLDILQKFLGVTNDEKANLEKKLKELVGNGDSEDDASAVKASLEKDFSDWKSEVLSLQQRFERNSKDQCQEIKSLRDQASCREREINVLASERQKKESEKKKADQYRKTSSDLPTLTSNLETVKKKLELEKQKTQREKKHADMESAKAKEQVNLTEDFPTKFANIGNEELKKEAESVRAIKKVKFAENSGKVEEKRRLLEMNKRTEMGWNSRADDLTKKSTETCSVSPHKAEIRLLKKQLRFERERAKHSKVVAKFEKHTREFVAEELDRLKLQFCSLTAGLEKMIESQKNRNGEKHPDATCQFVASSGSRDQARKLCARLIPRSGHGMSESASGKRAVTVTTSAEIAKDRPVIQPINPNMFLKNDTRQRGNLCLLAENGCHEVGNEQSQKRRRILETVKSPKHLSPHGKETNSQIGEKLGTLQSIVVETRYRHVKEIETLVPVMQGGASANCNISSKKRRVSGEKKTTMQKFVEFNRSAKTPGGSTRVAAKTMNLSTAEGHDSATIFMEDVAVTDYMNALELDKPEEESYYKMATESLLSPDLPQVDFLDSEIVREDTNPASDSDTINSSETPSLKTQNASVIIPPESPALHGPILKHFVVFSNIKDQNSIMKVVHAANNCVRRCPSVTRAQWAVPAILFSLKMEKNPSAKERACVFLSLLLYNFSMVSSMNDDYCSCLDSFSKHIYGAMADIEAGGMDSELVEELLGLLQDLLSEQKVLYSAKSSETSKSDLSINVTLNGVNVALISRIALTDHLVAGSALLAAIFTSVDRVGMLRKASFVILHKHRHDQTSVPLTILHVFAYVAGEKMISSNDRDILIAVLNSIVMLLENKQVGHVEGNAKFHLGKNKCPFSGRSSPLETVASNLMEILQDFTQSNNLHQSLAEFRPLHQDFLSVVVRGQSVTLRGILSLVELIAFYTAWDWTNANIIAPLLDMLGMPLPMNLSVAIVSLLGQLSSIGVNANGYENEVISNLREKLSSFLQRETTLKAGFGAQIRTVSSLLKTLGLDLATVLQGKSAAIPVYNSQSLSASVDVVNKWFLLLSDEQQVFTSQFLSETI